MPSPSTRSSGERVLFDLLERADLPGWIGFHSLSVSRHEYKRWGELDFVLLSTYGLLALEVKGGRVAVTDGLWTFTDRWNEPHQRSESPFKQAETGLMGLKARLEEMIAPGRLRELAFGYGVVFPQTEFGVVSVEWSPETVLDQPRMSSPEAVGRWLRRLASHWQGRTHSSQASDDLVREVRDLLRPEFERVPSLLYRVEEAITVMDRLTDEQYRQLDFIEANPRLLCEGGAGTGKTFLAAELARREAARGRRVLFTCWSPTLAAFVRSRVDTDVEVVPWAQLPPVGARPYDSLIVDEAQDVLTVGDLDTLNRLVEGGLEQGRWAVFLDPNLQSALVGTMEPEALELLRAFGGVPGVLRWNCRNTEPIVVQTRCLTGADLGNPSAGYGPPVDYESFVDLDDCARHLERHLERLIARGVAPADITILSPRAIGESSVSRLGEKWRRQITELTPDNAGAMPLPGITFSRIEDFKGLENKFIAVVDLERFDETRRDVAAFYVAMSRARAGLYIAAHESLGQAMAEAAARNVVGVVNTGDAR